MLKITRTLRGAGTDEERQETLAFAYNVDAAAESVLIETFMIVRLLGRGDRAEPRARPARSGSRSLHGMRETSRQFRPALPGPRKK